MLLSLLNGYVITLIDYFRDDINQLKNTDDDEEDDDVEEDDVCENNNEEDTLSSS